MDQAPFYAIWRTPKLHVFSQHHRSQNRNAVVATVRVGRSRLWWKKVNSVESYNDILQSKYIASIVSILNIGSILYYSVLAQFSIGKYQSKKNKISSENPKHRWANIPKTYFGARGSNAF
jgi:hypothetical protein